MFVNYALWKLGDTRIGQEYVCETKVTQTDDSPASPSADE